MMKLFFTDEAIAGDSSVGRMSIYGGLVLSENTFKELTIYLYGLKQRYALPQTVELKWGFGKVWESMKKNNYLPEGVNKKTDNPNLYDSLKHDYDSLKSEVLEKINTTDAWIIVAIRPDELLNATPEQKVSYAVGAVYKKFDKLLHKNNELGIMLADELQKRFGSEVIDYEYILNTCCDRATGKLQSSYLVTIIPTVDSHISPIHQLNDIVLGATQYYILEFLKSYYNNPSRDRSVSIDLLNKFRSRFYSHIFNKEKHILNSGIILYPPKSNRQSTPAGLVLNELESQLKSDFDIK